MIAVGCGMRMHYLVAAAALGAVFLVSVVKTSVSVAIVAMVRRQSAQQHSLVNSSSGDADVCPGAVNYTSDTDKTGEGVLSWSELEQSYVLSAHAYGSVLSALALSRLAEMLGAGRVLVGLIAASAVLNLLAPAAAYAHVYWLVAVRALQGVAWGPLYSCVAILSARWFPPNERLRMSSLVFSAGNIGILASMGLSGKLAASLGWTAIFYCYGGILLAWGLLCLVVVSDQPSTHCWISAKEKDFLEESCPPLPQERPAVPWLQIAKSAPVWAYMLHDAGCVWITIIFMSELPNYLSSILHSDIENAGYLSTLPFVCTWLSNVFCGSFSDWLRSKGFLSHITSYRVFNAIATLGPALALLGVSWAGCSTTAVVGLVTLALTLHGAYYGGSLLNMLDLSPTFAGTLTGIVNTLSGLVNVAAPTLVGLLTNGQQTLSAWRTVFYVSAVVTSVPYVVYVLLGSVQEQPWSTPSPEKSSAKAESTTT